MSFPEPCSYLLVENVYWMHYKWDCLHSCWLCYPKRKKNWWVIINTLRATNYQSFTKHLALIKDSPWPLNKQWNLLTVVDHRFLTYNSPVLCKHVERIMKVCLNTWSPEETDHSFLLIIVVTSTSVYFSSQLFSVR